MLGILGYLSLADRNTDATGLRRHRHLTAAPDVRRSFECQSNWRTSLQGATCYIMGLLGSEILRARGVIKWLSRRDRRDKRMRLVTPFSHQSAAEWH